jgi:reverse gyrase
VYEYLQSNFRELVSEETSRIMENILSLVEDGRLSPYEAINNIRIKIEGLLKASSLELQTYESIASIVDSI